MKIRIKTFETNSSSSHSICINKNNNKIRDQVNEIGQKFVIEYGEYGWEFSAFYSPEEKASYILTDLKNNEELFYPNEFNRVIKALKKFIKKEIELKSKDDSFYPYGYADHQSSICEGDTHNGIFEKKGDKYRVNIKKFLDFVFSSCYYFRTGNDNV